MNTRQQILTTQFKRVSAFCVENGSIFLPEKAKMGPSKGQQIVAELDDVIAKIGETHVVQESGVVFVDTEEKQKLRLTVRTQLRAINQSVKFIAIERKTPAITHRFRNLTNGSDQMLITRALSICEAIIELQLEADLVAMKHPADFLSTLRTRIEEFQSAENAQSSARQDKAGATALLDLLIGRGKVLVHGLNVMVTQSFKGNPEKIAAWKTAYHIQRTSRRAAGKAASAASAAWSPAVEQALPPVPDSNGAPRVIPGLDGGGDHAR